MPAELFDPTTSPPEEKSIDYAPRPQNLEGLRVGLVDNTKYNSRTLLVKVAERLKEQFHTQTVYITKKQSAGHPVDDSAIEAMKTEVDFAIAGIGD